MASNPFETPGGMILGRKPRVTYRVMTFEDCTPPVYAVYIWSDGQFQGFLANGPPVWFSSRDLCQAWLDGMGWQEQPPDDD